MEFLISQISDNFSPKHFLCIGVWQLLQTKGLSILLFVLIKTLQIVLLIDYLSWLQYHISTDFLVRHLYSNLLNLAQYLSPTLKPSQTILSCLSYTLLTSNAWIMWAILTNKILITTEALIGILIKSAHFKCKWFEHWADWTVFA